MPLKRKLRDEALVLAASLKRDLADLRAEKLLLEAGPKSNADLARLGVLNREIQFAEKGVSRLLEYNPELQAHQHCPYCWIIDGTRIPLNTVPGPAEVIACWSCSAEYRLDRAE